MNVFSTDDIAPLIEGLAYSIRYSHPSLKRRVSESLATFRELVRDKCDHKRLIKVQGCFICQICGGVKSGPRE